MKNATVPGCNNADCSGTCGYPMETQMALRTELQGRYPEYQWIDVQSKSDLEIKEAAKIEGMLEISIENEESLIEFKKQLIDSLT